MIYNNTNPDSGLGSTLAIVDSLIKQHVFHIFERNLLKPWGGYVRLENSDAEAFARLYFPEVQFDTYENLSPKFLLVAPGKRLSWQRHDRRAELWRVLDGPVGIKLGETDEEPEDVRQLQTGEIIEFGVNVRHRLIGLESWGIVTEIWKHSDAANLSHEADIVRISDDFGR